MSELQGPAFETTVEEEVLYLLTEGSDLLRAGLVEDACDHFQRALALQPGNEQALNLLGLSLFRLERYEESQRIFEELVRHNPVEPSIRLNLAMVFLKTAQLLRAKDALESVLELTPDHPRAMSYMALVLERLGDLDEAADWYQRAGNSERAHAIMQRIRETAQARLAAAMRAEDPTPPPPPRPAAQTPPLGVPSPGSLLVDSASDDDGQAHTPLQVPRRPSLVDEEPVEEAPPASPPKPDPPRPLPPNASSLAAANPLSSGAEAAALTAAATSSLRQGVSTPPSPAAAGAARASSYSYTVEPSPAPPEFDAHDEDSTDAVTENIRVRNREGRPAEDSAEAGAIVELPELVRKTPRRVTLGELAAMAELSSGSDGGQLKLDVEELLYLRSDALVALNGEFEVEPIHRRYRGRRTESLFGGPTPLLAVLGRGRAVLEHGDKHLTYLTLSNEDVYLLESALLAFSDGLVWENGRLPAPDSEDLDVVHLRGSGRVVLFGEGPVRALRVGPKQPLTLVTRHLLGWTGSLVPYRGRFPGMPEDSEPIPTVRFEGEGTVISS